ncbi:MAG: hypothetical protein ACKVZ0_01860 [Gemmatimonadales bacterium]
MPKRKPKEDLVARRFWQAVTHEHAAQTTAEIRYFGVVKRIPIAAFPKRLEQLPSVAMEWDETADGMRRDLPASLPVSMQGWQPLPTGAVERYEAFDRDTGDLLVFWRVPCRRMG